MGPEPVSSQRHFLPLQGLLDEELGVEPDDELDEVPDDDDDENGDDDEEDDAPVELLDENGVDMIRALFKVSERKSL